MKAEKIEKEIIELVKLESQDGGLTKLLIRNHNLIAHSVPMTDWHDSTQNDLYTFWRLIEIIAKVEEAVKSKESPIETDSRNNLLNIA